ncbi:MAG: precorrin-8X methylmutase [Azospirillaceae bacterium]
MGPLFDSYVCVDWSAARVPRTGADSVWWAHVRRTGGEAGAVVALENPPTRAAATAALADLLETVSAAGERVLVGFDFPFGYASGTAARLAGPGADWRAVWAMVDALVEDGEDNANNRFAAAAALNRRLSGEAFPFWGHDGRHEGPYLVRRERRAHGPGDVAERRLAEHRARRPQPAWKLAGNGSVGGQALTGIPRLQQLRRDPRLAGRIAVWPFETGLRPPLPDPGGIVLAEVYPSLVEPDPTLGPVKDACQVATIAGRFATLDERGRLAPLFAGDPGLDDAERSAVEREEAWILGLTDGRVDALDLQAAPASAPVPWLADGDAIYRRSFARVRAAMPARALPEALRPVAERLVHAGAEPSLVHDLAWSPGGDVVAAARAALAAGRPVLADSRMVAGGVIARALPCGNRVWTAIDDPATLRAARDRRTTRSAAQLAVWGPALEGAVLAIGNAPTTLFALLDGLADGSLPRPAAILAFPVGFVGAEESKEALIARDSGIPWLTLRGRRGGSALAAAAVNALILEPRPLEPQP